MLATSALVLVPILRRVWRRLGLDAYVSSDAAADREPVVALHATVVATLAFTLAMTGLSVGLVFVLRRIQLESVLEALTVGGAVVAALGAGAVFFVTRALARIAVRRIDARVSLPRPRTAWLATLLFATLPLVFFGEAPRRLVSDLGVIEIPLIAATFVGFWLIVRRPVAWLAARGSTWRIAVPTVGLVATLVALAFGASAPADAALRALERSGATRLSLRVLRDVSDVDRDGSSSLFGGGDCAPWSRAIGPRVAEIPRNGVDENCDGKDGVAAADVGATFYEALDPALVKRRNVVWVIIDAVRADHVTTLGYKKQTTPYMDELAKDALVFESAYSQSSATMFSIPSMLSGIDSGRIEWDIEHDRPQPRALLLGERLQKQGYSTALVGIYYFVGSLPRLAASYEDVRISTSEQTQGANDSAALATQIIEKAHADGRPFFLTLYFAAPHLPYVRHAEAYPDFGPGDAGIYDGEIAYADRYLGFVLDVLQQRKEVWDDTIVVVTSDHGEELREHGARGHAQTCFEESTHVPLFVRIPGVAPARVEHPVALVDVLPTLIETLGLPRDDAARLTGKSLLATRFDPSPPDRPITCSIVRQSKGQPRDFRRAIRLGKWTYEEDMAPTRIPSLYDTSRDPMEKKPLVLEGDAADVARDLGDIADGVFTGNMGSLEFYDE
ncbi:MAG TPA: sulfatase-like hydrolase/transferase [Polyangiaceae bacterium]|nr:sulfatase-like hydrolase/transferase [Polyangiaceae bacterium]